MDTTTIPLICRRCGIKIADYGYKIPKKNDPLLRVPVCRKCYKEHEDNVKRFAEECRGY